MFTVYTSNVRSLRTSFGELLTALDSLGFEPDIIALTETWIGQEELMRYRIDGYNIYLRERQGRRSGGVILYAKVCHMAAVVPIESVVFDGLKCELRINGSSFSVMNVYRYCGGSRELFYSDLEKLLG